MFDIMLVLGMMFFALLGLRTLVQLIQTWIISRTIKQAMEKRPEDLPTLIDKLDDTRIGWRQDLLGCCALAIGLGVATGAAFEDESTRLLTLQAAMLPLFMGSALLLHYRFMRKRV